jgi:hypothetical protein
MSGSSMGRSAFRKDGNWYKGNLHSHTALSDGHLEPEGAIAAYKRRGYHFLALTEHNLFTSYAEEAGSGCLTLPSFEYNLAMDAGDGREFHFCVYPAGDTAPFDRMQAFEPRQMRGDLREVQAAIDEFTSLGCLVTLNHPLWSMNELEDILPLSGYFAIEIYNHSSSFLENKTDSTGLWDALLRRGRKPWGVATDDNHNARPSPYDDSFGGWICAKAERLDARSILSSLAEGSFYSSSGPEIHRFEIAGDHVFFECSPVDRIYLNADGRQYQALIGKPGEEELKYFSTKLAGDEKYVRMECVDSSGRRAYTNPLFLDDAKAYKDDRRQWA